VQMHQDAAQNTIQIIEKETIICLQYSRHSLGERERSTVNACIRGCRQGGGGQTGPHLDVHT